jgi:hypothetical protein
MPHTTLRKHGPIRVTVENLDAPLVVRRDADTLTIDWDEDPRFMRPIEVEQFQDGEWHTLVAIRQS